MTHQSVAGGPSARINRTTLTAAANVRQRIVPLLSPHFGLKEAPSITPNTEYWYPAASGGNAPPPLLYAIGQGESIIKVWAKSQRKTMQCRSWRRSCPTASTASIWQPYACAGLSWGDSADLGSPPRKRRQPPAQLNAAC